MLNIVLHFTSSSSSGDGEAKYKYHAINDISATEVFVVTYLGFFPSCFSQLNYAFKKAVLFSLCGTSC